MNSKQSLQRENTHRDVMLKLVKNKEKGHVLSGVEEKILYQRNKDINIADVLVQIKWERR